MSVSTMEPLDEESSQSRLESRNDGKMMNQKPWRSQRNNRIIILDWDDTILASSFLQTTDQDKLRSEGVKRMLRNLEDYALELLKESLKAGTVIIVTNAETGWVEVSASVYMPRVGKLLKDEGIRVVSARSNYESRYPGDPLQWKLCAFFHELANMCKNFPPGHIVVLGDGLGEYLAARAIQQVLPCTRVKTIKFVENPSVEKLIEQQAVVKSQMHYISRLDRSFEVRLS